MELFVKLKERYNLYKCKYTKRHWVVCGRCNVISATSLKHETSMAHYARERTIEGTFQIFLRKKNNKALDPKSAVYEGSVSPSPFKMPSLQNTRPPLPSLWLSIWGGNFSFRIKSQVKHCILRRIEFLKKSTKQLNFAKGFFISPNILSLCCRGQMVKRFISLIWKQMILGIRFSSRKPHLWKRKSIIFDDVVLLVLMTERVIVVCFVWCNEIPHLLSYWLLLKGMPNYSSSRWWQCMVVRPVHKNLFLEFPKYPGRFMSHFDI